MKTFAVFGDIYGCTLEGLSAALNDAREAKEDLELQINSFGGDCYAGLACYNQIRNSGVKVSANVLGICASAATFILLACDARKIASTGTVMIHEAESGAFGRAEQLENVAAEIESANATMAKLYATRTGMSIEDARAAMKSTTYYSAEAAKEAGLVQEVYESTGVSDAAIAASLRRSPHVLNIAKTLVSEASTNILTKENTMSLEEILEAVKDLSDEDKAKVRKALSGSDNEEESDVTALGKQVLALCGEKPDAAIGIIHAWKVASEQVTELTAKLAEKTAEVETDHLKAMFAEFADRMTPALEANVRAQYQAKGVTLTGIRAWLKSSPKVIAGKNGPKPPVVASGAGGKLTFEGKTYAELLAKNPSTLAKLRRDDPQTYEALRESAQAH